MCSPLRHFGNCHECAANGAYEATVTFVFFFFWYTGMNSSGEDMGNTAISKTYLYFISAQNYLLCFSEPDVQGGTCSSLFPFPPHSSFAVLLSFHNSILN